jgi:hypothetical protein
LGRRGGSRIVDFHTLSEALDRKPSDASPASRARAPRSRRAPAETYTGQDCRTFGPDGVSVISGDPSTNEYLLYDGDGTGAGLSGGVKTLAECTALCAGNTACTGIEHTPLASSSTGSGRCEVWIVPILAVANGQAATTCYVANGIPAFDGACLVPFSHACRSLSLALCPPPFVPHRS